MYRERRRAFLRVLSSSATHQPSFVLSLSSFSGPLVAFPLYPPFYPRCCAASCLFRTSSLSPSSYFISVPSSSLASSAIPPCSPVVGSADFFLGYRPVDRAAIRWTAIRIDYSLPKLRRGAFILYNSPAALVPSLLFPRFFLARYNRARLVRDVTRANALARSLVRALQRRRTVVYASLFGRERKGV